MNKIPYLSLKVVKVKKDKCKCLNFFSPAHNGQIKCSNCGRVFTLNDLIKPKGNWVNGENLDKIKFPCFCSYGKTGQFKGILIRGINTYRVYELGEQKKDSNDMIIFRELKQLIKEWNIHILKGKIIIFEKED